jgi:hypothetical protein
MEAGFLRGMLFLPALVQKGSKMKIGPGPAFEPSAAYLVSSLVASKSYPGRFDKRGSGDG